VRKCFSSCVHEASAGSVGASYFGVARRNSFWTATFLILVSVCLTIVLYSDSRSRVLVELSLAGLVLTLYPIYNGLKRGSLDLFEPPVIAALLSYAQLLRPLYWLSVGGPVLPGYNVSPEQAVRACVHASMWVYIGFVTYYLCYYGIAASRRLVAIFPHFRPRWSRSRMSIVVLVYAAAGLGAYAMFMRHVGGFGYFLAHIYVRAEVSQGEGPLIVTIQAITAAWLIIFLYATSTHEKIWPYVVAGIPVLALISTLGGRGFILYPVLLCLVCHHYLVRRMKLFQLALIAICFVTFAGGFKILRDSMAIEREASIRVLEESASTPFDVFTQLFQEQSSLDVFAVLIDDMPDHLQFQLGRTWLNLLALPIPSNLWRGKPVMLEGRTFGEIYFGESGGRPPGYAGALYMNFYYLGIVPGFALLGIFHKALYRYLAEWQTHAMAVCFYAVTATTLYDLSNIQIVHWLYWGPLLLLAFALIGRSAQRARICPQPSTTVIAAA
jgi:hypothetical protein